MITERQHWLSITDDPGWRRDFIADPNISLSATVDAIVAPFPPSPKRIIEIGCGYGRLTREISARFPKAAVTGIDVNPDVLKEARAYDPDTHFMRDDTLWSFGVDAADAIYTVAVFQHLTDFEKHAYITQAHDVLSVGGVLRVQFIEGDRNVYLDHWVSAEQMVLWAHDAGYTKTTVTRGLCHPQWSWLTCTK